MKQIKQQYQQRQQFICLDLLSFNALCVCVTSFMFGMVLLCYLMKAVVFLWTDVGVGTRTQCAPNPKSGGVCRPLLPYFLSCSRYLNLT